MPNSGRLLACLRFATEIKIRIRRKAQRTDRRLCESSPRRGRASGRRVNQSYYRAELAFRSNAGTCPRQRENAYTRKTPGSSLSATINHSAEAHMHADFSLSLSLSLYHHPRWLSRAAACMSRR